MRHSTQAHQGPTTQPFRRAGRTRGHRLPTCPQTGLPRYRDRHQALQGGRALSAGHRASKVSSFACPSCGGFHVDEARPLGWHAPRNTLAPTPPIGLVPASTMTRRYVLFDVENLTHGAKATPEELASLWERIAQGPAQLNPTDHVVVGAARAVAHRYRSALPGRNIKWVVGANAPDGADRALLAAINLFEVARRYDELVILSGDHAFADIARRARAMGLNVHVVTVRHPEQRSMLARSLRVTADKHTVVDFLPSRLAQVEATALDAA